MIGTCTSINIWDDPWLFHTEQCRPIGPVPENLRSTKVSDLFLPQTTEWDTVKLEHILSFHKEQVLRLKPSKLGVPDQLVWLKNPSGEYSTRSCYLTLSEEKDNSQPMPLIVPCDWLSNFWKIKTSEKIKLFIWKSLQNALPVGEQFAIRNIPITPLCKRCNMEESVLHLLFLCPYATSVWDLAPLSSAINFESITNYQTAWEQVKKINSLPPTGLDAGTIAASIVWNLWISRNQLGFQNRDFSPEETIEKAIVAAREWKLAQPPQIPSPSRPLIRLEPSPNSDGLLPIFTDAAWNSMTGHAGLGWILDDPASPYRQSTTETFVVSPLLEESLAVQAALTSALSRGQDSVKILADSQSLITTLNRRNMNLEIFGVLQDIYLLLSSFKSIKFVYVPRAQNAQADTLAKQALWALNPLN